MSRGEAVKTDLIISGVFGIILLALSLWLVVEAFMVLSMNRKTKDEPVAAPTRLALKESNQDASE